MMQGHRHSHELYTRVMPTGRFSVSSMKKNLHQFQPSSVGWRSGFVVSLVLGIVVSLSMNIIVS